MMKTIKQRLFAILLTPLFLISCDGDDKPKKAIVELGTLTLNATSVSLTVGDSKDLSVTLSPEDISETVVLTWTSSDATVVSVSADDETGLEATVTAISAGTATVIVANEDGSVTTSSSVTVTATEIAVTGIALQLTTDGDAEKVYEAVITPADATNKNVTWTTSDDAVATVLNGTLTLVSGGEVTLTATSEDGSFTATADWNANFDANFDDYCAVNGSKVDYYPATVASSGASTELDYTGVLPTDNYDHSSSGISASQGASFDLSITQGSQWALTLVYFDWNADGVWDVASTEAGILFGTLSAGTANPTGDVLTKTINVPADAVLGTTRMRVVTVDAWTTDIATGGLPCGSAGHEGVIRNSSIVDFDIEILTP